jgi:riboflavin biosynthesis RibT protein
MLVQFNNDYEKIAMGLLSYISDLKDTDRLAEEMERYETLEDRELYLWQSQETKNLIGVAGVEEEEDLVLLRHISIDPSFRNEGLTYKILDALKERYADKNIVATLETASIISKWQKRRLEQ